MQIVFLILNLIMSGSIQYAENDISMEICHSDSLINIEDSCIFKLEVCFKNHSSDTIVLTSYYGFSISKNFNRKRFMKNVKMSGVTSGFNLVLYHDNGKLYEESEKCTILSYFGFYESPDVVILYPYDKEKIWIKYFHNLCEMPPNGNYKGRLYYYQNRESIQQLIKNPINLNNPEEILNIMQVEMLIPEKDSLKIFDDVIESEFFDIHIGK